MNVRNAERFELDRLAELWHRGWQDAHLDLLPNELARLRTRQSFRARLDAAFAQVRVAGPVGAPAGLCIVKGDELYQLYVAAQARGTGVAAALIDDAEHCLSAAGVELAWLACAIGNERAARFYHKRGWRCAGHMINRLDTPQGVYPLQVWRYEKPLAATGN